MIRGNPPPPLDSPPPSRLSTSSASSMGSSPTSSPRLTPLDSSSALILVHDDNDDETSPFHLDSEDENEDQTPQFDVRRSSTTPLSPALVFLYLLAPYLKLGAMFLPHTETPLNYGLPALFLFATLAAFAKHILYKLSRYARAAELEDVILDICVRGRGRERLRIYLRNAIRAGTGGLRILVAIIYLRECVQVLLSLFPHNGSSLPLRMGLTVVLSIVLLPLSLSPSLGSKRAAYSTCLSLFTYLAWLGCIIYAYVHQLPLANSGWLRTGTFWQGIVTIAFAFTSSSTLSLYSSLRGSFQPITTTKPSKLRSFKLLSVLSVAAAVLLVLPLVIFSANPHVPATLSSPRPPALLGIPILNAATLLLWIPALAITTPSLSFCDRLRCVSSIPVYKILFVPVVAVLSLVPENVSAVFSDILLLCACTSTYLLPALLHVIAHFFKRPIAIVMPQVSGDGATSQPQSRPDELLLRKERALQRKQFQRRIVWDLGVWVLLVGGAVGFLAAFGRVTGQW